MNYVDPMKNIALILAIGLATPVTAEESDGSLKEGMELFSEGTRMLLEGLLGELEPALDGLGEALSDLSDYHMPEVLPNGDIIIRRKEPLEIEDQPLPEGEIEI
ncbi:MAG: hypothetical protein AAGF74_00525 [Pseudomonadota bacterium]